MKANNIQHLEAEVLQEALTSPSVALMRLSMEIDRQLRLLLSVVGGLSRYNSSNPVVALDVLSQIAGVTMPLELRGAISDFWNLRNKIVHGQNRGPDGLALRAIDYGLRILRILVSTPRPKYVVRFADVPLYKDQACNHRYDNVTGVILESFSAEGKSFGLHIHPTTLSYSVGDEVTWEWNLNGPGWDETWYHDPVNQNQIKPAWSGSLEYQGRKLNAV